MAKSIAKDYKFGCQNCHHFDGSKWENDERTKHAGLCKKFSEMTFRNDTCNQFFDVNNLPPESIFAKPIYQPEQTTLDL